MRNHKLYLFEVVFLNRNVVPKSQYANELFLE